jgi:hypothetical protein
MKRLVSLLVAAVALTAIAASVGGCQPKQNSPHDCPCVCYYEKGNTVIMSQASTSTTLVNCGDLNGTACTGNSGGQDGQSFSGTLQHCGPYTNVADDPLTNFLNGSLPKAHQ